jgi:hypothetical protein
MSDPAAQDNSAWVTLEVPASPAELFVFLQNIERLFHLNPYLDIKQWVESEAGRRFHLQAMNEMNGVHYDLDINVESNEPDSRLKLRYSQGLKAALEITLQGAGSPDKTILTLREHYHQPTPEQREQQLKEIDHSLIPWGNAILAYVRGLRRWAWFWPYRWYREKFWLGMRPTHRRIAGMIGWVTLLEFVVFLFVFIIYWLELARKY